ncbi:hypothetical protein LLS1_01740 [Leifsonia sp. LS1]|nr:hypothetical protein LLS1_01740 [Leifsonia sp. LS1]
MAAAIFEKVETDGTSVFGQLRREPPLMLVDIWARNPRMLGVLWTFPPRTYTSGPSAASFDRHGADGSADG